MHPVTADHYYLEGFHPIFNDADLLLTFARQRAQRPGLEMSHGRQSTLRAEFLGFRHLGSVSVDDGAFAGSANIASTN